MREGHAISGFAICLYLDDMNNLKLQSISEFIHLLDMGYTLTDFIRLTNWCAVSQLGETNARGRDLFFSFFKILLKFLWYLTNCVLRKLGVVNFSPTEHLKFVKMKNLGYAIARSYLFFN